MFGWRPWQAEWLVSDADTFRPLLLLALHAGNGAPRGAADLGDDAFLLVFRQVFHQSFVGVLQFGIGD